jgi:hypothetical protein
MKILNSNQNIYFNTSYNDVYYSTKTSPENVSLSCPLFNQNKIITSTSTILISDVGKLTEVRGCKIITHDFEIEIESSFVSNYRLTLPTISRVDVSLHFRVLNDSVISLFNDSLSPTIFNNSNEVEITELMSITTS